MKKILFTVVIALLGLASCAEYLDRPTLNAFDESNFWRSESTIRMYAQGAYTAYFGGYGSGYSYGNVFTFASTSDEYISTSLWGTTTAASGNGWDFSYVRRFNLMLNRVETSTYITDDVKKHWTGIARFFRALEYYDLCSTFGDMPYFDREVFPSDLDEIYKDRQPVGYCVTKIIEDFDYAAANVRADDGVGQINRSVVLAYMVRRLLFLGTMLKYHNFDQTVATACFNKVKWAAEELINGGKYRVSDDYRALFTTNRTLSANPEVIFQREYLEAACTHAIHSYCFMEGQTGSTLKVINNYLSTDGLPIKQSPLYNYSPDKYYEEMIQNRDPRLLATFADTIRPQGVTKNIGYSTSGIAAVKFLSYTANASDLIYMGSTNVTACPLIRFGEVLVAYAEAMAELGQFTQAVADASINKLRARNIKKNNQGDVLPKLPPMVVSGTNIMANGVVINDPDRDPTVSPILWEIRRERWAELVFEGQRRGDLKRWKKFSYLKTVETNGPTTISMGAPFNFYRWGTTSSGNAANPSDLDRLRNAFRNIGSLYVYVPGDSTKVATYNLWQSANRRDWVDGNIIYERQYFTSVPTNQLTIYKEHGYKLTQNPGWDDIK